MGSLFFCVSLYIQQVDYHLVLNVSFKNETRLKSLMNNKGKSIFMVSDNHLQLFLSMLFIRILRRPVWARLKHTFT